MGRRIAECKEWHLLGLHELERWGREECESDQQHVAVEQFLIKLGRDPLLVEGIPIGMGFEGRFFRYLTTTPVIVSWLVAEKLCVVTLLQIENIPR